MLVLEEAHWEVALLVKGDEAFVALFWLRLEAVPALVWLDRHINLAADLDLGLAALEHQRCTREMLTADKYWVLELNQGSERAVVVLDEIMLADLLDVRMNPGYRDVISNSDVTSSISSDLQVRLVFRVKDEKHLLLR